MTEEVNFGLLEPPSLWKHFEEILKVPRESKHEDAIREHIIDKAKEYGLEFRKDEPGNIVVRKPGTEGRTDKPVVVLQGHMDMVCEKEPDVEHDFRSDPIKPRIEDDGYLYATGTTLGSDNGIGLAAMLAVMQDKDIPHGPLEFLFTTDEETGLTGAFALADDMLEGRIMLNLDTEEKGALYVGCAGGADTTLTLDLGEAVDIPKGFVPIEFKLGGMLGGHSGVDIHLGRANANKLMARLLRKAAPLHLAGFEGGSKRNAIPRDCRAVVAVAGNRGEEFQKHVQEEAHNIQAEFATIEKDLSVDVQPLVDAPKVFSLEASAKAIGLINSLPHGVQVMSADVEGLVETSTNVATVKIEGSKLEVGLNSRSSVKSGLDAYQDMLKSIGELAGAQVDFGGYYPGWKPNMESKALAAAKEAHTDLFGKEPEIKAIHAGLETGIIGEKFPGMDMVSMGPQIEFPHSPGERCEVASVKDFYRLLVATLHLISN